MSSSIPMIFEILQDGQVVSRQSFDQTVVKVGSSATSHLRLEDGSVSRTHAVIEVTPTGEVLLLHVGSSAGTFVNGEKQSRVELNSGDELKFGDVVVRVKIGDEALETTQESAHVPAGISAGRAVPRRDVPAPGGRAVPAPGAAASRVSKPSNAGGGVAAPMMGAALSSRRDPGYNVSEVETDQEAVEVRIEWGHDSVLFVDHFSPIREVYVGEEGSGADVDYEMNSASLGTSRMPVCLPVGESVAAVVPQGATGRVTIGDQSRSFEELESAGQLQACAAMPGAKQYILPKNGTAHVEYGGFTFVTSAVPAGKPIGLGWSAVFTAALLVPLMFIGGAFVVIGGFMAVLALAVPSGDGWSSYGAANTDLWANFEELEEVEEEEEEEIPDDSMMNDTSGGTGKRHAGSEGQMGDEKAEVANNRYAIKGPADNQDPHMAKQAAIETASTAGILGVLSGMMGSVNAPTSPFGRETALGNDATSAMGNMFGDNIGNAFGFGGLGLKGTGRGGGGDGEGTIGLGNSGTIGHGAGGGTGQGYGSGAGGMRGRKSSVPKIRPGAVTSKGSLSKEVIRRIVRRHLGEVKHCYERQLQSNPGLSGRVAIAWVIAPSGRVQASKLASSTLGNGSVEGCIVKAVKRWTFPKPDGGGIVQVTYPFTLQAPDM